MIDLNGHTHSIERETMDNPFADCENTYPRAGETTHVDGQETSYGGAVYDMNLSDGDVLAVWVSGHWLVGEIGGVSITEPETETPVSDGRLSISLSLSSTHRDVHDDLPTTDVTLKSSTDSDYTDSRRIPAASAAG